MTGTQIKKDLLKSDKGVCLYLQYSVQLDIVCFLFFVCSILSPMWSIQVVLSVNSGLLVKCPTPYLESYVSYCHGISEISDIFFLYFLVPYSSK